MNESAFGIRIANKVPAESVMAAPSWWLRMISFWGGGGKARDLGLIWVPLRFVALSLWVATDANWMSIWTMKLINIWICCQCKNDEMLIFHLPVFFIEASMLASTSFSAQWIASIVKGLSVCVTLLLHAFSAASLHEKLNMCWGYAYKTYSETAWNWLGLSWIPKSSNTCLSAWVSIVIYFAKIVTGVRYCLCSDVRVPLSPSRFQIWGTISLWVTHYIHVEIIDLQLYVKPSSSILFISHSKCNIQLWQNPKAGWWWEPINPSQWKPIYTCRGISLWWDSINHPQWKPIYTWSLYWWYHIYPLQWMLIYTWRDNW